MNKEDLFNALDNDSVDEITDLLYEDFNSTVKVLKELKQAFSEMEELVDYEMEPSTKTIQISKKILLIKIKAILEGGIDEKTIKISDCILE
jgi:hypothetical protein